jgi:hypothetical protein
MSIVNNPNFPQANPPAPKSKNGLLFALLGCGGGLMLVCCGGGGYLAYLIYNLNSNLNNKAINQAAQLASYSTEVRKALGNHLKLGMPVNVGKTGKDTVKYRVPIYGNVGNGDLEVVARFDRDERDYRLESARVVTSIGKIIELK